MKIAVLIITYNRVEDAKIQMEIIRNLWKEEKKLKDITIFHTYNGKNEWYPKRYLEDKLIRIKNPGHHKGAILLLNEGFKSIFKSKIKFDFIIAGSSDRWLIKPKVVFKILYKMKLNNYQIATSKWFYLKGLSTEFFIISPKLARCIFPISENELDKKYVSKSILTHLFKESFAENIFAGAVCKSFNKSCKQLEQENLVLFIPDKRNVNWLNSRYRPKLGYISFHSPFLKRKIVKDNNLQKYGKSLFKLSSSEDLEYYIKSASEKRYDNWIEYLQYCLNNLFRGSLNIG